MLAAMYFLHCTQTAIGFVVVLQKKMKKKKKNDVSKPFNYYTKSNEYFFGFLVVIQNFDRIQTALASCALKPKRFACLYVSFAIAVTAVGCSHTSDNDMASRRSFCIWANGCFAAKSLLIIAVFELAFFYNNRKGFFFWFWFCVCVCVRTHRSIDKKWEKKIRKKLQFNFYGLYDYKHLSIDNKSQIMTTTTITSYFKNQQQQQKMIFVCSTLKKN